MKNFKLFMACLVAVVIILGAFVIKTNINTANAIEDVTPPILLDFTISPTVFDTGPGDVTLNFCITVQDNLAGVRDADVKIMKQEAGDTFQLNHEAIEFAKKNPDLIPILEINGCAQMIAHQFSPYATYTIIVDLHDVLGNWSRYTNDSFWGGNYARELCPIGPCQVVNRPEVNLPDTDNDGVPDDADNCPNDPNSGQEDRDLDLIGDVCDPFPDRRDNDLAQCELDLEEALSNPNFDDDDGDGEHNQTDQCPNTPEGEEVDQAGCSLAQFCELVDVSTRNGVKVCKSVDWKNDEPLTKAKDCKFDRNGTRDKSGDKCIPNL